MRLNKKGRRVLALVFLLLLACFVYGKYAGLLSINSEYEQVRIGRQFEIVLFSEENDISVFMVSYGPIIPANASYEKYLPSDTQVSIHIKLCRHKITYLEQVHFPTRVHLSWNITLKEISSPDVYVRLRMKSFLDTAVFKHIIDLKGRDVLYYGGPPFIIVNTTDDYPFAGTYIFEFLFFKETSSDTEIASVLQVLFHISPYKPAKNLQKEQKRVIYSGTAEIGSNITEWDVIGYDAFKQYLYEWQKKTDDYYVPNNETQNKTQNSSLVVPGDNGSVGFNISGTTYFITFNKKFEDMTLAEKIIAVIVVILVFVFLAW
ncbi:MAG: hypothetical protein Q6363_007830 [Candidatus Njordarchaeota archaeon]